MSPSNCVRVDKIDTKQRPHFNERTTTTKYKKMKVKYMYTKH